MPAMTANIRDGVPRDDELLQYVDGKREIGDTRAPILRELLWMGVGADRALDDAGISFEHIENETDRSEAREEYVREAIRFYAAQSEADAPSP